MSPAQSQLIGLIEIDAAAAPLPALADHLSLHGLLGLSGGRCGELAGVGPAAACGDDVLPHRSSYPADPTRWPSKARPRPFRDHAAADTLLADLSQLHEDLKAEFSRFLDRLVESRGPRGDSGPGGLR